MAEEVVCGGERFAIDASKQSKFPYGPSFNHVPAGPSNIAAGGVASFFRLPTPVVTDYAALISELTGVVEIRCEDVYGTDYLTRQEFRVFCEPRTAASAETSIVMTFGDERPAHAPE